MRLCSYVTIEQDNYIIPGRVTPEFLMQFNPLRTIIAARTQDELIDVWVTEYLVPNQEGVPDEYDRDLTEAECEEVGALMETYSNNNQLKELSDTCYRYKGLLDKPYVEYFDIKEPERSAIQLADTLRRTYNQLVNAELDKAMLTEMEKALWFRYNRCSERLYQDWIDRLQNGGTLEIESVQEILLMRENNK